MADESKSYVLIKLYHYWDLGYEDTDGNFHPISPETLPDQAYLYRGMIGEVNFPETKTIGRECFKMCAKLDTARFPMVESIGAGAFNGCISLEELDVSKLTEVKDSTFQNCAALRDLKMPNVRKIGNNAFQGCSSLCDINRRQCIQRLFKSVEYFRQQDQEDRQVCVQGMLIPGKADSGSRP